jgi:hypothetical protein
MTVFLIIWYNYYMTNEYQFLIDVLVGRGGPCARPVIGRPQGAPLRWDRILALAQREGVFYPFYQKLVSTGVFTTHVPPDIQEKYKRAFYAHISESEKMRAGIERIMETVPILVFKGPAIDSLIYDGYIRPRIDIDIAMRSSSCHPKRTTKHRHPEERSDEGSINIDFSSRLNCGGTQNDSEIEKLLRSLGYQKQPHDSPLPEYLNSTVYTDPSGVLPVIHLHRHIINNMYLSVDGYLQMDMERVWQETEPFQDYADIFSLKPEMNIIYLCEHALKHDFDQLVHLYEIYRLMEIYGDRLDRNKLNRLADEFGLKRIVDTTLHLVNAIFSGMVEKPPFKKRYQSFFVYLACRKGIAAKVKFAFLTLFPPGYNIRQNIARIGRCITK